MSIDINRHIIADCVEICKNDEEYYADIVYFNSFFLVIPLRDDIEISVFKLTEPIHNLTTEEKQEVLDYCLGQGNYTDETVSERDVFLHGKFIKEL